MLIKKRQKCCPNLNQKIIFLGLPFYPMSANSETFEIVCKIMYP